MSVTALYDLLCLAEGDREGSEVMAENASVIWGHAFDVVSAAASRFGNIQHEYTSAPGSPILDSRLLVNGIGLTVSAPAKQGDNHEVIQGLSQLLDAYELLFVTKSNGSSDLAFIIDTKQNVSTARDRYGYVFYVNFVPVAVLPDLWQTPGSQIAVAIDCYARPWNLQPVF